MIWPLVINEWRALLRDGRGLVLLGVGLALAIFATWTAGSVHEQEVSAHGLATERARSAWLEREGENPHSRAHYGDYVYRPAGPLAGLDSGLQRVTGRSVRLEAHGQSPASHVPHRQASTLLRFDRLEPSTVLTLLVPLLLTLVGFGTVAGERQSGRLRLLLIQGLSPLSLLLAKAIALWAVGAAIVALVAGVHLLHAGGEASMGALFAFLALHLLGVWVVASGVVCISAWSRRPGATAGLLLGLWILGAVVLPRLAAMAAEVGAPLPDRDAFEAAMEEDRAQGLDGHNPEDERSQALEAEVLAEYGVATKDELPINLDGVLMQADEEFGNRVWDKHYGRLEERLRKQAQLAGVTSLINPMQAVDRLSMGVAGTGLNSHLAFLAQVEAHRREFVERLNKEHAFGGSKTGDWDWKADQEFFAGFDSFQFEPLTLGTALRGLGLDLLALALWVALLTGVMLISARRMGTGGAL